MAASAETPPLMATPQVRINHVPAKEGDIYKLGILSIRIIEDGSRTGSCSSVPKSFDLSSNHQWTIDNRLGAAELILPPNSSGPLPHWHEMHDEGFLVTKGTVRFHTTGLRDAKDVDCKTGDFVTVPVRAPHTFSNPFDEEARFFNTFTPAFYVNYFKLLSEITEEGRSLQEANKQAMAYFATMPVAQK